MRNEHCRHCPCEGDLPCEWAPDCGCDRESFLTDLTNVSRPHCATCSCKAGL